MGNALPRAMKIKAEAILEYGGELLTDDFEKNKEFLNKLNEKLKTLYGVGFSKRTRNKIAGYITRKIKKRKEEMKKMGLSS